MKKLVFLLILGVYGVTSFAQCQFDLDVRVIKNSDCMASGIIQVGLSGDEIDLDKGVYITLSGANQEIFSSTNGQLFTNRPAGDYIITAKVACKNSGLEVTQTATATVTSDYPALIAHVSDSRKSLSCVYTGMVSINMSGGKSPYTIKIISAPATYSGQMIFATESGNFTADNLPSGEYKFTVTDDCSSGTPVSINLIANTDFPSDPYETFFYPKIIPNNCNTVSIHLLEYGGGEMAYYWNKRKEFYEVAFSINGNSLGWMPVDADVELVLPYTLKQIRNNGYTLEVKLRLKGCPATEKSFNLISLFPAYIAGSSDITTCDFLYKFHPVNICFPYSWEIRETVSGILAASGTAITNETDQNATLLYDKQYTLIVTDNEGEQTMANLEETIQFSGNYEGLGCDSMNYSFAPNLYCFPYSWEIHETVSGNLFKSRSGVDNGDLQTVTLAYYKKYQLKITKANGEEIERDIYMDFEIMYSYNNTYGFCLPDTFMSYYYFWFNYSVIPAGTRIETIGPAGPISDVVLDKNMVYYYPFSDNHENQQLVKLKDGRYTFKITVCDHPTFEKIWDLYNYEIRDFSYTEDKTCSEGTRIFPTGQFYSNNIPQETIYRMEEYPEGADVGQIEFNSYETDPVGKTGKYFRLPKTGRYVIGIRYPWSDCRSASIEINYEVKGLEFDDYSAYTCEQGGIPKFFFKAKSGTLPYTYELYENNVFIQSNQTGDFEYGNVNNEYRIDVTDACGAFFSQDIQVIDIFNYEIIRGDKKVCAGGAIELGCMSLGSTNFSWTGPNGFSSDKQNVSLSNVTTDNAGTYMVTLKPFGCGASISRKTDVEVNTAPPVSVPETIFLCVNGDNTLSGIEPLPNHSLIWYANDKITECPPPVVNTGTVHEEVFYLSQKMDDIGCESEKVKVTIAVKAALASEFSASADEICYKSSPSILLDHLNVDYTYEIYSDKLLTNKLASTTGEVSKLIELDDILEDETTYYIKENDDAGCVSLFLSEVNVTVRKLNIMPENLPPYRQTVAYEQNLTTNGEAPKFTLSEGYLPEGLALSSTGKISGIVPNSERERKTEFTVKVEDVNGCIAFREYVLEGDFVVPKAFTPNGDGVNDYFMLSYKVIIFDRLGIVMFEGEDGWDGTYKGKVVKPDIYFYTLFYQTNLGETKTITGYVGVASR